MSDQNSPFIGLLLIVGLLLALTSNQSPSAPPSPPKSLVKATLIYEKSSHEVPSEVAAALRDLRASGVESSAVDQDVKNGDGDTPKQYAKAIDAAKKFGLPCVALEYSDDSVRCVKASTRDELKAAVNE
jgi:hypothetical protein